MLLRRRPSRKFPSVLRKFPGRRPVEIGGGLVFVLPGEAKAFDHNK
jgi:hypothetical protein